IALDELDGLTARPGLGYRGLVGLDRSGEGAQKEQGSQGTVGKHLAEYTGHVSMCKPLIGSLVIFWRKKCCPARPLIRQGFQKRRGIQPNSMFRGCHTNPSLRGGVAAAALMSA